MTTPTRSDLLGDFTQVQLNPNVPIPIMNGVPGVTVTLANQDLTNVVTIARRNAFTQNGSNTATIPPLGSITVDASKTIWGLAPAGALPLLIFPGGGNWAPSPAQVAAQIQALGLATLAQQITQQTVIPTNISTTGVPLLNLQAPLTFGVTLPATAASGGSVRFPASGQLAFNQPSFEMILALYTNTVNATFVEILIQWFDSSANLITQDIIWCYPGTNLANEHNLEIHGITKGNAVAVTVSATNNPVTVGVISLYPSSRIIELDTVRTQGAGVWANGAITQPSFEMGSHIMGQRTVAALGAGATDNATLPLCGGKVWVFGNTASGTSDMHLAFTASTDQAPVGNHIVAQVNSDGNGNINSQIYLPQAQCNIAMVNTNAAAKQCQWQMLVAEY